MSYHFLDALLSLGVANSVPLADAPSCPLLILTLTPVLTIGLVCEGWTTPCFPGVTDDNTQFHSMCERVCVCVHISTLHGPDSVYESSSRIVTSFRTQDTQRVFVRNFCQPHRMSSDISSSVSLLFHICHVKQSGPHVCVKGLIKINQTELSDELRYG